MDLRRALVVLVTVSVALTATAPFAVATDRPETGTANTDILLPDNSTDEPNETDKPLPGLATKGESTNETGSGPGQEKTPPTDPPVNGSAVGPLANASEKADMPYLEQIRYNDELTGPADWGPSVTSLRNESVVTPDAVNLTGASPENGTRVVTYDPDANRTVRTSTVDATAAVNGSQSQPSIRGIFGAASVENGTSGSAAPTVNDGIIGEDGRLQIDETERFPWSAVVELRIVTDNGQRATCSGVVITEEDGTESSNHVLTAGHCVYLANFGGFIDVQPESVDGDAASRVVPGADGSRQPFGTVGIEQIRTYRGWTENQDPRYDIALLTLDERIGDQTGSFGYTARDDSDGIYSHEPTYVAGYPGDKSSHTMWYDGDEGAGTTDNYGGPSKRHRYLMDIYGGMSGGPVWVENYGSLAGRQVVSINAYAVDTDRDGETDVNWGTRITESRYDDIQQWTSEDDVDPDERPDLVDDGIEWSEFGPTEVAPGQSFSVESHVRNIGSATAGCFDVTYYASTDRTVERSDQEIGTAEVCSLAPTEYKVADWSGELPSSLSPGTYYVGWIIDEADAVEEEDESNNRALNDETTLEVTESAENDRFEPNDDFATATDIDSGTYEDLQILDGESDVFAVDVDEGQFLEGRIDFSHAVGDLDLYVYNSTGVLLTSSFSTTDDEAVGVTVEEAGTYFVEVRGYIGASAPYSLTVNTTEPPENDRFEPNDDYDTATPLEQGEYGDLQIVLGEYDVYAVDADVGTEVTADIAFSHDAGDLNLYALSPGRTVVDQSRSVTNRERVDFTVEQSDDYYVVVTGYGGASAPYSMAIRSGDNELPQATFDYDPTEPTAGETVTFDASDATDPDGSLVEYRWDFTDDGTVDAVTSDPVTDHSYVEPGNYSASLTVVDDSSAVDTTIRSVNVTGESDDPEEGPTRTLSSETVTPGGTVTVTLEATMGGDSVSFQERFEPEVESATVEQVTVDGAEPDSPILAPSPVGVVVAAGGGSAGSTATAEYTIDVSENASVGTTFDITGNVTSGTTENLGRSQVTVVEGSSLEGPAGEYDENGDGEISDSEFRAAIGDWATGDISDGDLQDVIRAWASS